MSYYGCTAAGHNEHTCLSAYYTGPARFKKREAWCDSCKQRYPHPSKEN